MYSALNDASLYGQSTRPLKQLRGAPSSSSSNVPAAQYKITGAANIFDLGPVAKTLTQESIPSPLSATPNRQKYENFLVAPIPADAFLGTDMKNQLDTTYSGIKIASHSSRPHNLSPEYMARQNRILERREVDPYSGKLVDYYRSLPPEGNKDYRLPKETMQNPNLRFLGLQGYDHTRPKQQRRERLADAPQPDKQFDEAATYMRRLGEMRERIERDLHLNQNGTRPQWIREHQRAFGHTGYRDDTRVIPNMPVTFRSDTKSLPASHDQTANPTPKNEVMFRKNYTDDAKRNHDAPVDYRAPAEAPNKQAPVWGDSQMRPEQKRSTFETQAVHLAGPSSISIAMPPLIGEMSEPRNVNLVRDPNLFYTRAIPNTVSSATQAPFTTERHGNIADGQSGHVGGGFGIASGAAAGNQHLITAQHADPMAKREGTQGSSMYVPQRTENVSGPTQISRDSNLIETKRTTMPTNQISNMLQTTGATAPTYISQTTQQAPPKREDLPTNFFQNTPATAGTSAPTYISTLSDKNRQTRENMPISQFQTSAQIQMPMTLQPNISVLTDHSLQKREGANGGVVSGYASAQQSVQAGALIMTAERTETTRQQIPGVVSSGHGSITGLTSLGQLNVSQAIHHVLPQREQYDTPAKTYFTQPQIPSLGPLTIQGATHLQSQRIFSDAHALAGGQLVRGQAAAEIMGPTAAPKIFTIHPTIRDGVKPHVQGGPVNLIELGSTPMNQDNLTKIGGYRSDTGNVSAATYLHGGGAGNSFQPNYIIPSQVYDQDRDRTTRRKFNPDRNTNII